MQTSQTIISTNQLSFYLTLLSLSQELIQIYLQPLCRVPKTDMLVTAKVEQSKYRLVVFSMRHPFE